MLVTSRASYEMVSKTASANIPSIGRSIGSHIPSHRTGPDSGINIGRL